MSITLPSTPAGLAELVFRHKKKIIFLPLLCLATGALVILFCPRTYQSEAKLFLRVGRESVGLDPSATTGQTIGMSQMDRKDEIKSAVNLLSSRGVLAKTVDLVGPDAVLARTKPDDVNQSVWIKRLREPVEKLAALLDSIDPVSAREQAIIRLERNLSVEAERESNVISVNFRAKTPQLAQQVCDTILQVYQQEHMRIYRSAGSRPFFAEQRDRLRDELDTSLEQVRRAKDELGMSNIVERRTTLESQFSAIELEKFSTQQQFATAVARAAELEDQLAKISERLVASNRSVPNQGADLLREQLYALEMKAMDMRARYSDDHPLVQAIQQQLQDAQAVVAQQSEQRTETTDAVNPIHRQLTLDLKQQENQLAGLHARLAELDHQKQTVLADLRSVNDYDLKIDKLQREADLSRDKYVQYARNFEEARVDQELEDERISNVSIAQAATFAEKPIRPSKALVLLASLALATMGTVALVLASEQLNDKLRADADVADSLGVAVLGSIPDGREFRQVYRSPASEPVARN